MQLMLKDVVGNIGAECLLAGSAQEAEYILEGAQVDLAILDRQLSDSDGLLLVQTISQTNGCPVMILSGMSDTRDKIMGIGLGATEYLTKPVNPLELCARIKSILSSKARPALQETAQIFSFPGFSFNAQTRRLDVEEDAYLLAPAEAKLLHRFLDHLGEVQHREQLYNAACSRDWTPGDRTIDVLVSRLRRKLADTEAEIVAVHRAGWRRQTCSCPLRFVQRAASAPSGTSR